MTNNKQKMLGFSRVGGREAGERDSHFLSCLGDIRQSCPDTEGSWGQLNCSVE